MLNLFLELIKKYNQKAFTHNYIYGFNFKNVIYWCYADASIMPLILKLDKASRGAGYSLRFKPTKEQKILLLKNAKVLCSKKYFDETKASSKYNKGEIFEKLITEHFNQVWCKDNIPFTKAGDIEINGTAYQIKFEGGTFCNEKSISTL